MEIDGDIHSSQQEKDKKRDEYFIAHDYRVLRIPAFEVLYNLSGVRDFLEAEIFGNNTPSFRNHTPSPTLPNLGRENMSMLSPTLQIPLPEFTPAKAGAGTGLGGEEAALAKISNYEFFMDSHIPTISSTEIRAAIPEYANLRAFFENDPKFIIP